jgi:hypothetical protein
MTRRAACSCGQLNLTIEGEPSRIAMCHCLECQRRTGAVISNQARFRLEQISFAGETSAWTRTAESGHVMTYHFCPICGSTVFWENQGFPGHVTVAIGNFADPTFPRTDHRSLGGDKAPVGLFATQHTSQACVKAGIDPLKTECRLSAVDTSGPPG